MVDEHRADVLRDFLAAGHTPRLDEDGKPDFMAYSVDDPESIGGHNGLYCETCESVVCEWCVSRYGHKIDACE